MRLAFLLGCALLLQGCAAAPSNGGLWAQQNLEREAAFFRVSEAQHAAQTRAFELAIADEILTGERTRIEAGVQACPGAAREPLAVSAGDRVRDTARVQADGDRDRLTALAQVALADWRLRRAGSTGDAAFCALARAALAGTSALPATADALEQLGVATVTRLSGPPLAAQPEREPLTSLSLYATGFADTISARAPLPQYLAAVYGGTVIGTTRAPLSGRSPEILVDELAPAYPEWEPDALYAALSAT